MPLSARRRKILEAILPEVVPSKYGSEAFEKLDKTWKPGDHYTTCGGLPAYVASRLGVPPALRREGISGGGLASVRSAAVQRGAWVHHNTTLRSLSAAMGMEIARPQPGDIYVLCSGSGHDTGCNCVLPDPKKQYLYKGAHVEHIGVVVDASTNNWRTADSGQGDATRTQEATYVSRTFDANTGFMTGEAGRMGKPMRRLCGWVDIDAFPFLN